MSPFDTPKRFAVILGALLVAVFTWGAGGALAQNGTTLSIDTERAQSGEAVDVPVQATSFNDVGALSLTLTYDPAVTSFPDGDVSTGDLISGAPRSGFEATRPEPGELRITFFDTTDPIDFGDGTLLNLTFSNFAGGAGDVVFEEADSEVSDAQGDPIAVAFENGTVIDQDAGTVSAESVSGAELNETVSVPLSGQDIGDVGSASLELSYDASVLQFEGIANDQSGLNLSANASDGMVRIAGQNATGGTLGDQFVEVEFAFAGGSSDLDFLVGSELADPQGNVLPAEFASGSVTGDTPVVSFPDRAVNAGDTISVPVQAEDLRDIGAVTLETTFDPSVLTFDGTEEGLDALSADNPSSGVVRIAGQMPGGIDPSTNGDKFINLIFAVDQGLDLGTEGALGFNAGESEIASTDAIPYNTEYQDGLVRVEETEIAVSSDSLAYDVTAIDSTSNRVVTVTNESDSVATLEGEVSGTDTPFAIASGGGSFTLAPSESRDIAVDYAPTEVSNPDQDTLLVSHNADNQESPVEVPLSGQAEAPQLTLSQEAVDYEVTTIDSTSSQVVTITNGADQVAELEGSAGLSGTDTPFAIAGGEGDFSLGPGDSLDVTVDYGPATESDADRDTLAIENNDPSSGSPLAVPLSGQAEAPSIAAQVEPDTASVRSGEALSLEQTVTNNADSVAVLEAQVTDVPGFLTLTGSSVEGGGSVDADSLALSLEPGAEATLTYEFQEEVDSTTTFDGAIAHETNDPANPTVDLPVSVTAEKVLLGVDVTRTFADPSDPANYEIVALPGDVDADPSASLDGTQGPDWRVLREEGGDGNLIDYDDNDAFRFDEGRAFWVIAKDDFTFQDTVDATDASGIELQADQGWTTVSNPLQEDLVWSAIQNANGLDEALWRWADSGNWEQADTLASAQSGEGFYVFNPDADRDSLSLTSSASGQNLVAGGADEKKESSLQAVELTAQLQNGAESGVTVGLGEETSVYHAPPAHFESKGALRVLGSEGDREYARMIAKSEGTEATAFDLMLRGEENGGATLEASGLDSQSDQGAVLVVEETGDRYDLRETSSVTVPTGENGEARLTLHVGTQEQVQEVATPDETKLRGNYPNPFSAQTTLELSISEPTDVKVQVYNVLGQRVATVVDESMDAGTHQLTWEDGSLASGTYFVRMNAGGTTDVHKITVVR